MSRVTICIAAIDDMMPAIKAKKVITLKCILIRPAIFRADTIIWLTGATISNKSGINW